MFFFKAYAVVSHMEVLCVFLLFSVVTSWHLALRSTSGWKSRIQAYQRGNGGCSLALTMAASNSDSGDANSTRVESMLSNYFGGMEETPFGSSMPGVDNSVTVARIPMGPDDMMALDENEGRMMNAEETSLAALNRYKNIDNRYFKMVDKLQPNEMLQRFAQTAPKNVQEAAKSTIVNILGSLPNYALDASLVTTNTKLANLMFQMEVTGYMLKNAEYRMSLTSALKGLPRLPGEKVLEDTTGSGNSISTDRLTDNATGLRRKGVSIDGEVVITGDDGRQVKLSAEELTEALGQEVSELRNEIAMIRGERESELRANLLTYIQALPENDLARLTSDMSDDVMESIQLLVEALMEKLGVETEGPEVVIQQSVSVLAQLCMWQMVVGYKLRELEAMDRGVDL